MIDIFQKQTDKLESISKIINDLILYYKETEDKNIKNKDQLLNLLSLEYERMNTKLSVLNDLRKEYNLTTKEEEERKVTIKLPENKNPQNISRELIFSTDNIVKDIVNFLEDHQYLLHKSTISNLLFDKYSKHIESYNKGDFNKKLDYIVEHKAKYFDTIKIIQNKNFEYQVLFGLKHWFEPSGQLKIMYNNPLEGNSTEFFSKRSSTSKKPSNSNQTGAGITKAIISILETKKKAMNIREIAKEMLSAGLYTYFEKDLNTRISGNITVMIKARYPKVVRLEVNDINYEPYERSAKYALIDWVDKNKNLKPEYNIHNK